MAGKYGKKPNPFTVEHDLTPREWDALLSVARFGRRQEAADDLGITLQTLKNLITTGLKRLDVPNVTAAWRKLGWLRLPEALDAGGWPLLRTAEITDVWIGGYHLVPDPEGETVVTVHVNGTYTVEHKVKP